MKRIFSIIKLIISLSAILLFSGCGTTGGTPKPITIDLAISASNNINPDIEQRASPIIIRIYQLNQIDTFNNSDFFALYEDDKSILAKDLKFREELEVQPNQSKIKPLDIYSTGKYIAVVAAFRDLDKAQWKSFLEIDPLHPQPLKIEIGEFKVSISTNFVN